MKALVIAGLEETGLVTQVQGQGWFELDNATFDNGVVLNTPGYWYNGVFGLEVWELNRSDQDLMDALNFGLDAFEGHWVWVTNGFLLETIYANKVTSKGLLDLNASKPPDVYPPGSIVMLALVCWNTSAASFSAFFAGTDGRAGMMAFRQPTTNDTLRNLPPRIPPLLAWPKGEDLVLYALERTPAFARQPQSTVAAIGGTASISFTVGCNWNFNYRWRFSGQDRPAVGFTRCEGIDAWLSPAQTLAERAWPGTFKIPTTL